ncbi:NAD(P)-dependent alcohol dehydrogenase [Stenotrophomonas sp. 3(2025)]|uniref:NAD(P)-dependent alcohol dehydrogenase n=1 Tax=Stenotrophomonas sp. 3(2025) TaxID=3456023 RepID=UPI004044186B
MAPVAIERRALRPNDVLLDVMYCGVCHSDIHAINSDWGKTNYPCVPGHEAVGKVIAIGSAVTKFRVGDIGGVGCMVDSCGTCEQCLQDREQSCVNATTFTYDAPDKVSGGYTYGGYSDKMVVAEHFVIRIPPGMDLAAAAPLLCAGVTTFSPIRHWQVKPGQRVGVVGLGGLGHMAVKLAVAQHARVTVFTTSPGKLADANRLGAEDAVLWTEAAAMTKLTNQFDLIISTVPEAYDMQPFIQALKVDATMVNVGALGTLEGGISGMGLAFGRKSLAGSMIGGIAETQEVIDYCNARNIKADVEVIRPDQINLAFDRVTKKDVRYRFVIDMAASKI